MREIKFKVWNGEEIKGPFDLSQNPIYWEGLEDGERFLYTGLKDKNGVEIYEFDIIKIKEKEGMHESNNLVVWGGPDYPAWDVKPYWDSEMNAFSEIIGCGHYEIEVIGNLYENKELLGE